MSLHLFVKDAAGKLHRISGRRATALRRALVENSAQGELVALAEAGYSEFVGKDGEAYPIDQLTADQFH